MLSFKNVRNEAFRLPSFWVLGNSIKIAQTFLFLFALDDNSPEESCDSLPPVEKCDQNTGLIMELSTQVSLQSEKIAQLEEALEEKEKKIQQLEAERSTHPSEEVKDSPACLEEAPVLFNDSIIPMASDEDM